MIQTASTCRYKKRRSQKCRRKIEMSPGAQSRDDTPIAGGHDQRPMHHAEAASVV